MSLDVKTRKEAGRGRRGRRRRPRLRRDGRLYAGTALIMGLVVLSLLGPWLSPHDPTTQNLLRTLESPSWEHWFGTDALGRDLFARVWWGGRVSLFVAVTAACLDLIIGVTLGATAGFFGGRVDAVISRIIDLFYGLPYVLMVILFAAILGPGLINLLLALVLVGWVEMARVVRAQVLQLREESYLELARSLGVSRWRRLFRHILPNASGEILVLLTLHIPAAMFHEAFLSFIGLGLTAPLASWGTLISTGYPLLRFYPWLLIFPGVALAVGLLGFTLVGDALRDRWDPRVRELTYG